MSVRNRMEPLEREGDLPLVIRPESGSSTVDSLADWIREHRALLEQALLRLGALLFRGTPVGGPADFRRIVEVTSTPLDYIGGVSPRGKRADKVYESSYSPPHLEIISHNEMVHLNRWADRIVFCCMTPAREGGETPVADGRKILRSLRPETREKFETRRVRYGYTFPPLSRNSWRKGWEEAFETRDRTAIESICRGLDQTVRWNPDGSLTTFSVRDAVVVHPGTKEACWFNQVLSRNIGAIADHPASRELFEARAREFPDEFSCTYGDGGRIGIPELRDVREAVARHEIRFAWEKGDILFIDNVLCTHGRRPYKGDRDHLCILAGDVPAPSGPVRA